MKHRILIAEDQPLLREGLRSLLSRSSEFEIVGEARDGFEAVAQAKELQPDLILMDLSMPRKNGVEAIAEILKFNPKARILILTVHQTEEYVMAALKAGALGYVLKDASHDELNTAIKSALAGKNYLSPEVSKLVVEGYVGGKAKGPTSVWDTLTPREKEVIKLIAEGQKSREIADQLRISEKTVEKHRANLMTKLDLHSVSALTAYAARNGVIS